MLYHLIALLIGVILDFILGDPYSLPHPIRLIGSFISVLDRALLGERDVNADDYSDSIKRNIIKERIKGALLVIIVILTVGSVMTGLIIGSYFLNIYLGIVVEAVFSYFCLAAKSLKTESMKVYYALNESDIDKARYAVSMIVGRDTDRLDETGIIKATVETIAENTSDGVIAPMIYLALGGPIAGMIYKAINTMDSMIGYRNDRYLYFGTVAARTDDVFNYIPSRISALIMIVATMILRIVEPVCSAKNAIRIYIRDRYNHKSPNSAQTESVCAGALGLELAGDAYYFGRLVKKPTIGDYTRSPEKQDIKRACKLMYMTTVIMFLISEMIICILTIS